MSYIGELLGLEKRLKETTDEKEREEIEREIDCCKTMIRMEDARDYEAGEE